MLSYRDEDSQIFVYEFLPRLVEDMDVVVATGLSEREFAQLNCYVRGLKGINDAIYQGHAYALLDYFQDLKNLIAEIRDHEGLDEYSIQNRRALHSALRVLFNEIILDFEIFVGDVGSDVERRLLAYRGVIFDMLRDVGESRLKSVQYLSELTSANRSIYSHGGRHWSGVGEAVSLSTQQAKLEMVVRCQSDMRAMPPVQLRALAMFVAFPDEQWLGRAAPSEAIERLLVWSMDGAGLDSLCDAIAATRRHFSQ